MHSPVRAVSVAVISCFLILLLISSQTTRGQERTQQNRGAATAEPAPSATPPAAEPATPPQKQPDDLGQGFGQGPVITNTDLITFTVTVTDTYGRFVSGLGKSAFTVLDEKKPQEITYFSDDDAPVSVGVIFDVSGSMGGDKINRAREALSKFIQTSHNMDEYFLIAFNSRAQLLLDRTRDGNAVLESLPSCRRKTIPPFTMPAISASRKCSAALIPSAPCF